jgi:hypothetical protein
LEILIVDSYRSRFVDGLVHVDAVETRKRLGALMAEGKCSRNKIVLSALSEVERDLLIAARAAVAKLAAALDGGTMPLPPPDDPAVSEGDEAETVESPRKAAFPPLQYPVRRPPTVPTAAATPAAAPAPPAPDSKKPVLPPRFMRPSQPSAATASENLAKIEQIFDAHDALTTRAAGPHSSTRKAR